MNKTWRKYFSRRAATRPLHGKFDPDLDYRFLVVIPARGEKGSIPGTLSSIQKIPTEQLNQCLVTVVVNNPPPASARGKGTQPHHLIDNNMRTLRWLENHTARSPVSIAWIDAASPGNELSPEYGVGMARKIGCDTLLKMMYDAPARQCGSLAKTIIFHLDADTLVRPDYLDAGKVLLNSGKCGGAIQFSHRQSSIPRLQTAIVKYELYLRYHTTALEWAGSPYAFHSIGSTMINTADGYIKAGGMPAKRLAGEDFYFMQRLAKTGGVENISSTCVFPSPRISTRVPFGTGPRMDDALNGRKIDFTAHSPKTFATLKRLLRAASTQLTSPTDRFLNNRRPRQVAAFLEKCGFCEVLPRFQKQFGTPDRISGAFNQWFDGLKTLRMLNHLSRTVWPEIPLMQAWEELLALKGIPRHRYEPGELLSRLRG